MKTTKNAIATVPVLATVIMERPISAIAAELVIDAQGNVNFKAGSKVNAYELGMFGADKVNQAESATLIAGNTLILSRNLADVKLADGKTMSAFDYTKAVMKDKAKTESAFFNALGIVTAIDIQRANAPVIGHLSPFAVKEALGTLNREKLIDPKTLKLKSTADASRGVKKLVAALKDKKQPIAVNAIRPLVKAARPEKPTPEPEKPFEWTVDALNRQITTVIGSWEKTVEAKGVDATRKGTADELAKLAKLAGYELKPLAIAPAPKAPAPATK